MAINLTRYQEVVQKKSQCVLAIPVSKERFETEDIAIASDSFLSAILPPNAVITDAYVSVKGASDAATSATVELGTTKGGTEILAAVDVKVTGVAGTLVGKLDTGSGQEVWMDLTYSGATTDPGDFTVVVEYTEYELNNGAYTMFDNRADAVL